MKFQICLDSGSPVEIDLTLTDETSIKQEPVEQDNVEENTRVPSPKKTLPLETQQSSKLESRPNLEIVNSIYNSYFRFV